jgi:RNA binding exosome subunit
MYAMIEAEGYYRDNATVIRVYTDREKALRSVMHDRRWQVIGSPDQEFEVGQQIHRTSIGSIYHTPN